jgi:hypothetical protein
LGLLSLSADQRGESSPLQIDTHYAASQGEQDLAELTNRLVKYVKPKIILSIGTAGGARNSDRVGTVNVVHSDTLYENNQLQNDWPNYTNARAPNWSLISSNSRVQGN